MLSRVATLRVRIAVILRDSPVEAALRRPLERADRQALRPAITNTMTERVLVSAVIELRKSAVASEPTAICATTVSSTTSAPSAATAQRTSAVRRRVLMLIPPRCGRPERPALAAVGHRSPLPKPVHYRSQSTTVGTSTRSLFPDGGRMPGTAPHRESLRVLLDGNWWIRGPISNREVMREITFTWARLHPEDSLTVAVPLTGVKTARQELAGLARVVSTRLRPQGISAILELALLSLRLRPDITLAHNFTPLLGRSAVFIQDFLFLSNPEWFTRTERAYFSLMPLSVRRANVVIASSVAESERIVRTSAAPRAVPVGLGLNRAFAAAEPVAPAGVDGLDGFLLAVGRLTARKNLATTIEAALASGVLSPSFPLLVVGEASGALAEFPPAVRAALDDHLVRLLGRIETEELRWLYENAALFLFLTLDEGFGLPTLEALACRTPILASDIPVFREILGERARLVDPRDVPAIAASIRELVANPPQPPDPTPVLEYYSWDAVVTRLRAAITEVLP
ncbi:hypothetical protein C5C31_08885 [Rathayibacter rathayi]|nr:hypothetical protein C5C02_14235 [Rathayibacter rathayi]PPG74147.1 hypothetical protein C5C23_13870 [Rathayibacter rathayi]PPH22448.1 hypothetical protein C5C31_08885 [Rathayibacter rathayi]PPI75483.1 hypothetical protein C5E03_13445 [Rathayibacter rathayi]